MRIPQPVRSHTSPTPSAAPRDRSDADTRGRLIALGASLASEIPAAFEFAGSGRETLTFFGSARIREAHPVFAEGRAWGEAVGLMNFGALAGRARLSRLAESGAFAPEVSRAALGAVLATEFGAGRGPVAARARLLTTTTTTGAGPGMMEAVPLGVLRAREVVGQRFPEGASRLSEVSTTRGSRIKLPFEQITSSTIEDVANFEHFLPRRLALTENASGFVVFPGGFGTINELLEVMRKGRSLALHGSSFWGDVVDRTLAAWRARGLVDEQAIADIAVVEGPEDGLQHLLRTLPETPVAPAPGEGAQMAEEAAATLAALAERPTAVTFLGGRALRPEDPTVVVARDFARALADRGHPARVGGPGAVLDAVRVTGEDVSPALRTQVVGLASSAQASSARALPEGCDVVSVVHAAPIQKLGLYENSSALVALPGGIGTLDELFEAATLMQTRKVPKRPLILVGRDFWSPILEALEAAMRRPGLELIGPNDMAMFHVVDSAEEALSAFVQAPRGEHVR